MAAARGRPDIALLSEIARVAQLAAARLERALPDGLSASGFEALSRLGDGEATPLALARSLGLSKPAMTHTLQRLEARGWIEAVADPADGRRKRLNLTLAGRAAQQAALRATRPQLEALRAAFAAHEFAEALPFLRRLRAWLAEADG